MERSVTIGHVFVTLWRNLLNQKMVRASEKVVEERLQKSSQQGLMVISRHFKYHVSRLDMVLAEAGQRFKVGSLVK